MTLRVRGSSSGFRVSSAGDCPQVEGLGLRVALLPRHVLE